MNIRKMAYECPGPSRQEHVEDMTRTDQKFGRAKEMFSRWECAQEAQG